MGFIFIVDKTPQYLNSQGCGSGTRWLRIIAAGGGGEGREATEILYRQKEAARTMARKADREAVGYPCADRPWTGAKGPRGLRRFPVKSRSRTL